MYVEICALTKAKGKMYETCVLVQNTPVRHALPSLVQTRAIHHKHSFERMITWCKRERGVTYEEISGWIPGGVMRERGDRLGRDLESTLFVTNSFAAHFVEAEHSTAQTQ